VERKYHLRQVRRELSEDVGLRISDWGWVNGARHRAQGHLGHKASPSLGHYATLSFVVIGKRQKSEVGGQRKVIYGLIFCV
jgi:hypothetical protein